MAFTTADPWCRCRVYTPAHLGAPGCSSAIIEQSWISGLPAARWHNGRVASASVFGSCLLIIGSESLLADRAVEARVNAARVEAPDAELHDMAAIELGDGRIHDVLGGTLFASRSIVVVRDLANLPAEASAHLIPAATHPDQDLCLVLVHGGGNKGKSILEALKKGKVPTQKADPVKQRDLPGFLSAEARRMHVRVDDQALVALVESLGADLRGLVAALRQLADDHEGQIITPEVVRRFFSGRAEVSAFAVADDVMNGRVGPALERLRWALDTGCSPVQVTSAVASSLRTMGKFLDLRRSSLPDDELSRHMGIPSWKLRDVRRHARSWRPDAVAEAILAVAYADHQVKGAAVNAPFALEQMLLAVEVARTGSR